MGERTNPGELRDYPVPTSRAEAEAIVQSWLPEGFVVIHAEQDFDEVTVRIRPTAGYSWADIR